MFTGDAVNITVNSAVNRVFGGVGGRCFSAGTRNFHMETGSKLVTSQISMIEICPQKLVHANSEFFSTVKAVVLLYN